MNNDKVLLDVLKILLLLVLGSIMVYGIGGGVARFAYFTLVFILFWQSKNNVFWIAFFWIILTNSFGFFFYRWNEWYIQLTPTVGLTFKSFIPIVIFVKFYFIQKGSKMLTNDIIRPYYKIFGFYILFMLLWGFVYGYSITQAAFLLGFLSWVLLFVHLPLLFNKYQLLQFNRIVFHFSILLTLYSFVELSTEGFIGSIITFGKETPTGALYGDSLTRVGGGIYLSLYALVMSLYYLSFKSRHFSVWFLSLVALASFLFIFNSATRGWMMAAIFIVVGYLVVFHAGNLARHLGNLFIIAMVGLLLFFIMPGNIKDNIKASYERLSTVEHIAEGDMTAGGTAGRWDVRGPRVMERFPESPVFGFGYSKVTAQFFDNHVGNHMLLLSGGIVGFFIVYFTIIFLLYYFAKLGMKNLVPGVFVFVLAIIGIMIIHSTTRNMLSFLMRTDTAFFLAIMFNHVNAVADQYNRRLMLITKNSRINKHTAKANAN